MGTLTDQQLADKWIEYLTGLGYTPEQQIAVFRLAAKKHDRMLAENVKDISCQWDEITGDEHWVYNPAEDMNAPNDKSI